MTQLGDMEDNHGSCATCIWYSEPCLERRQFGHDCSNVDSPFHGDLHEGLLAGGCWAHEEDE